MVQFLCCGAVPVLWCSFCAVVQFLCCGAVSVLWCSSCAVVRCGTGQIVRCGSAEGYPQHAFSKLRMYIRRSLVMSFPQGQCQ